MNDRYARQSILPSIGDEGQRRIRAGRVLVAGCGALGSVIVDQLARAGVGAITIVDRDVVELSNLQRQTLFDERDAERRVPKAEAAKARVARVNRDVEVRAFWDDIGPRNVERYARDVDVIVDGLDNLETRYLLNDLSVKRAVPYVYGAAVGSSGMLMVVRPGTTPCLRCVQPEPPPSGTVATCDMAGVLSMATATIASIEAAETIKLLVGADDACEAGLVSMDLWANTWRRTALTGARDPQCPACALRRFEFLDGDRLSRVTALCGRNAVQIVPARATACDLDALSGRLASLATVTRRPTSLGAALHDVPVTIEVFGDGRTVVHGTTDMEVARSVVARFVGT